MLKIDKFYNKKICNKMKSGYLLSQIYMNIKKSFTANTKTLILLCVWPT